MMRVRTKQKVLAVHRWLALAAGLFVMSQGLSGMIVAFRYELNRALRPGAMVVMPSPIKPRLSVILAAAQKSMPGTRAVRVDYPREPDDAYIVRMAAKNGMPAIAAVDQAGHVTRAATLWAWPVELAYALHENLLTADEVGERSVGFIGLAVLILAVSGTVYWWPMTRFGRILANSLRPQLAKGRATRELHRAVGLLFSLYLMLISTLGLLMAWSPWVKPLLALVLPFGAAGPGTPAACKTHVPVDRAVAVAVALRPRQSLKSVRLQAKGRVVAVYFRAADYPPRTTDHVWVSACDASVLAMDDHKSAGDRLYGWLLPVHTGEWLGLFGRLLSWSAALSLVVMGVSGYVLWVVRLKKKRLA